MISSDNKLDNEKPKSDFTQENIEEIFEFILKSWQKINIVNFGNSELGSQEQLGIPESDYDYHMLLPNQRRREEVIKTEDFLCDLKFNRSDLVKPNSTIEFINYGDTELVYVIKNDSEKETLLVGQPTNTLGIVKTEYENLRHLAKKHPSIVVAPRAYVTDSVREAYITPYIYQARCIASQNIGYGAYIPEPYYRFERYSKDDAYLITKAIIATLIRLYDEEHKLALAECRIGGGDFILEKEFDNVIHSEENILKHLRLIAARKLITIELKEYFEILKHEFTKRTYYHYLSDKDPNILVNVKNRIPMEKEAIEDGITLGLKLRRNQ